MTKSLVISPEEIAKESEITFRPIPVNHYQRTLAEERGIFSDEDLVRIYRDMLVLHNFEDMLNKIKTQG
ncbi:hypothetical protein AGMMS49983_18610 [Clostridia bacterium]|nr:hypothetical protein AGMMS49983_18610 [Clostridia bacterium]